MNWKRDLNEMKLKDTVHICNTGVKRHGEKNDDVLSQ